LTSGIVEQLYGIVNTYAKERGFTVVLETSSGALVYADPKIDVTDEVIKRHNAR
jgi:Skp family chaperone for outer membrane proteins